jgi:hypothetical protein
MTLANRIVRSLDAYAIGELGYRRGLVATTSTRIPFEKHGSILADWCR